MAEGSPIVEIGARSAKVSRYRFLGVSGSVTIKGFFVDVEGEMVGEDGFTGTIPVSGGTNDPVSLLGAAGPPVIPKGAVGAIVDLSGDVYMATPKSSAQLAKFKANAGTKYPTLRNGYAIPLGFVAVS